MQEPQKDQSMKASPNERREETARAFAAIVDEERRARLEKNMRLRSMRLLQNTTTR
jgi:hypothetical protein